jgi:hypothetical protein
MDRVAEVRGTGDAANEDEVEAETGEQIGDGADDVSVSIEGNDRVHGAGFYRLWTVLPLLP